MNLQPSEFIATTHKHTTWSPALSYASGTTSSHLSMRPSGYTNSSRV